MSRPPSGARDGAGTRGSTDRTKAIRSMPGRWIARTPQGRAFGSLRTRVYPIRATASSRLELALNVQLSAPIWTRGPLEVR
jgi:hypothetical protein